MSDPLGNHGCKHASNEDEVKGYVDCEVSKEREHCGGVMENCEIREEIWNTRNHKKGVTQWQEEENLR